MELVTSVVASKAPRDGAAPSIGFACMDERLQRGSLAFGQRDRDGMLHGGSPAFS